MRQPVLTLGKPCQRDALPRQHRLPGGRVEGRPQDDRIEALRLGAIEVPLAWQRRDTGGSAGPGSSSPALLFLKKWYSTSRSKCLAGVTAGL